MRRPKRKLPLLNKLSKMKKKSRIKLKKLKKVKRKMMQHKKLRLLHQREKIQVSEMCHRH